MVGEDNWQLRGFLMRMTSLYVDLLTRKVNSTYTSLMSTFKDGQRFQCFYIPDVYIWVFTHLTCGYIILKHDKHKSQIAISNIGIR